AGRGGRGGGRGEWDLARTGRLDDGPGGIWAEHERLRASVGVARREEPNLPRRSAGESLQALDRDALAQSGARARGEPLDEVSRRDRGTPTSRSPRGRATATR